MSRLFLILSWLVFVAGCQHVPRQERIYTSEVKDSDCSTRLDCENSIDLEIIHELEARLIDIPLPCDSQPAYTFFNQDFENDNYSLGYYVNSQMNELEQFYIQEMDRLGWKTAWCMASVELLLLFKKPTRFCVISLRPNENKYIQDCATLLVIFVGKR